MTIPFLSWLPAWSNSCFSWLLQQTQLRLQMTEAFKILIPFHDKQNHAKPQEIASHTLHRSSLVAETREILEMGSIRVVTLLLLIPACTDSECTRFCICCLSHWRRWQLWEDTCWLPCFEVGSSLGGMRAWDEFGNATFFGMNREKYNKFKCRFSEELTASQNELGEVFPHPLCSIPSGNLHACKGFACSLLWADNGILCWSLNLLLMLFANSFWNLRLEAWRFLRPSTVAAAVTPPNTNRARPPCTFSLPPRFDW